MAHYAHLFTPIQIGTMTVANRICHVPTDVSSSNADGSVSERDIHHHSEIAKGRRTHHRGRNVAGRRNRQADRDGTCRGQ